MKSSALFPHENSNYFMEKGHDCQVHQQQHKKSSFYPFDTSVKLTSATRKIDRTELRANFINLRRLIHAMIINDGSSPSSDMSYEDILQRREMCRSLWYNVEYDFQTLHEQQLHQQKQQNSLYSCNESSSSDIKRLYQEVEMVCNRADDIAKQKEITTKQQFDWLDDIFFDNNLDENDDEEEVIENYEKIQRDKTRNRNTDNSTSDNCDSIASIVDEEENEKTSSSSASIDYPTSGDGDGGNRNEVHRRSHSTRDRAGQTKANIQQLQKQQRKELEEAISQMAEQLKSSTLSINKTLKNQTSELDEMEDLATQHVNKLSDVTTNVTQYNRKSWKSSFSIWTTVIMVTGTFLFCFVTMRTIPKRHNACLFACPSTRSRTDNPKKNQKEWIRDDGLHCVRMKTGVVICNEQRNSSSPSSSSSMLSKKRVHKLMGSSKEEEARNRAKQEQIKAARSVKYNVGDRVNANWAVQGTYYPGTIIKVDEHDSTVVVVQYDDDGSTEPLSLENVRKLLSEEL